MDEHWSWSRGVGKGPVGVYHLSCSWHAYRSHKMHIFIHWHMLTSATSSRSCSICVLCFSCGGREVMVVLEIVKVLMNNMHKVEYHKVVIVSPYKNWRGLWLKNLKIILRKTIILWNEFVKLWKLQTIFFHWHYFAFRRTSKAEMLLHTPKPKDFLIQMIINYHIHGIFNYLSNDWISSSNWFTLVLYSQQSQDWLIYSCKTKI